MIENSQVHLLVVEDDKVDVIGIKRALAKLRIANPITTAQDGMTALDMLRGENGQDRIPPPFIILLDLNMPRMGGLEFLDVIRADTELKTSVVFVMTTSNDEKDICAAYDKNIAGYIVKENAEETFTQALSMLDHYWKIIEFPQI